jgi:5-deoxy-glucuronate isomerase
MREATENPVRRRDGGPGTGLHPIAEFAELAVDSLVLPCGETFEVTADTETAWLLMKGRISGRADTVPFELGRESLFDESASCIHAAAGTAVSIRAETDCELTVYRCQNRKEFPARIFTPDQVPNEHRGKGQVAGRCLRFVRTIFDGTTSPREAELVLGEVVTLPGGWSSYPPHHHRQPEIYHYRFTEPQGYGHAELGESVFKVRDGDTVCIPPGEDHAQCAAPGYGMYYSWVIRHLPEDPYTVPDFTEEHAWTMGKDASYWWPGDVPRE